MTNDQAENALIAFVIVLAVLCLMCGIAFAQEHGSDTLTVEIHASVTAYCDTGSEYVKCEDVPVFPLTEEDYSEPPTPDEQWAALVAWKKIEPSN